MWPIRSFPLTYFFWPLDYWQDIPLYSAPTLSDLVVTTLDLGDLTRSIFYNGNVLPITLLSAAPSGAPPSGKGVVVYIDTGVLKLAAWDGAAWVTT